MTTNITIFFGFTLNLHYICSVFRRDAGVVDRGGLENRCTLTGTEGSNPSFSAYKFARLFCA